MAPLPKKKHSRARKGGRAAHHGLTRVSLSKCSACGATRLPHRACGECGYYNGRYITTDQGGENAAAEETGR